MIRPPWAGRARRSCRSALLVLLLLLGLPAAATGQARDREVVALEFFGNEAFADGELASAIATRASRCRSPVFQILLLCPLTNWSLVEEQAFLDEDQLPSDLLRLRVFYRRRGYRDVSVDTVVERLNGTVRVGFRIDEGRPTLIDTLRLEGLEGLEGAVDAERLRDEIGIGEGDPFDRVQLESAKALIRSRLVNRGFVNAVVLEETTLPTGEGARVTLQVRPGPRARIGEVVIRGTEEVDEEVVRRSLTLQEGDYFNQERLEESQRALFNLGALRFASIERAGEPGDSIVTLLVQVTEAEMRTIRVGTGISTVRCAQTEANLTHRNLFGGARRFELTGRLANIFAQEIGDQFPCSDVGRGDEFRKLNYLGQAEFRQPHFLSSANDLTTRVFLERETFPDIFVRTSRGGEVAVSRRLRARMPATLAYRPELTSFDESSADVFFCVNFGFCQPEDIAVLEDPRWLAPLTLSWRYDRTDGALSPTGGYYATAEVEGAGVLTGSHYDYLRLVLEVADFEPLSSDLVLAGRIRAGAVEPTGPVFDLTDPEDEVVHPRKRFFAGGAQSVRGFSQNLLGPSVLVLEAAEVLEEGGLCEGQTLEQCAENVAGEAPGVFDQRPTGGNAAFEMSVELRQDLGATWSAVGFVDLGQVWEDLGRIRAPVLTPGLGLRYSSPVGPLRLDLAYNPGGPSRLPVVVQLPRSGELIRLDEPVRFEPFTFDDPGFLSETWRRLQLHLSIGQAF